MNKTTTALTELISKIDRLFDKTKKCSSPAAIGILIAVRSEAISLLQKEREDMERFFKMAASIYDDDGMGMQEYSKDAIELFDNKFTQYKTETNG